MMTHTPPRLGRTMRMAVSGMVIGALLLVGCASDAASTDADEAPVEAPAEAPAPEVDDGEPTDAGAPTGLSGDAPRADIPIFPGAEIVYENVLAAAVEEVWVVDAPLDEVIDFYEDLPGIEGLRGSAITRDDGGGYAELELFSLVRAGETDRARYDAAVAEAEYGPLLRLAVVTPESDMLAWFGGPGAREVIPPGSTVIVFGVLTG